MLLTLFLLEYFKKLNITKELFLLIHSENNNMGEKN